MTVRKQNANIRHTSAHPTGASRSQRPTEAHLYITALVVIIPTITPLIILLTPIILRRRIPSNIVLQLSEILQLTTLILTSILRIPAILISTIITNHNILAWVVIVVHVIPTVDWEVLAGIIFIG
jgi:hypothetical protein